MPAELLATLTCLAAGVDQNSISPALLALETAAQIEEWYKARRFTLAGQETTGNKWQ